MLKANRKTLIIASIVTVLPALIGIGAAVGCLTGVVTDRVLTALKLMKNEK